MTLWHDSFLVLYLNILSYRLAQLGFINCGYPVSECRSEFEMVYLQNAVWNWGASPRDKEVGKLSFLSLLNPSSLIWFLTVRSYLSPAVEGTKRVYTRMDIRSETSEILCKMQNNEYGSLVSFE